MGRGKGKVMSQEYSRMHKASGTERDQEKSADIILKFEIIALFPDICKKRSSRKNPMSVQKGAMTTIVYV